MTLFFCVDVIVTPHFFVCGLLSLFWGKRSFIIERNTHLNKILKVLSPEEGKKSSLAKEMKSPMREYFWLPFRIGQDAPEIPAKKDTIQRISFIW